MMINSIWLNKHKINLNPQLKKPLKPNNKNNKTHKKKHKKNHKKIKPNNKFQT